MEQVFFHKDIHALKNDIDRMNCGSISRSLDKKNPPKKTTKKKTKTKNKQQQKKKKKKKKKTIYVCIYIYREK